MSHLRAAPEPSSELGRYRRLAPNAGLMCSPLQLGGMSLGEAWAFAVGPNTKEGVFKLLDGFVEAGGNMIDTANVYQNEQSETWIGEWMKDRGKRDEMVIATKYSAPYPMYKTGPGRTINYMGNSRRAMHLSVRDSLQKLDTTWIDILYVHWWDWTTSIEEVMDSLHMLVEQSKVLYLGICNTPAWIVSAANTYARAHGKTPFSIYQGKWNVLTRDMEREILPMCRQFGMAIAPYDAIGAGAFKSKDHGANGDATPVEDKRSADEIKMSEALENVAHEHGIKSLTAVALAYLLQKQPYVFPIIGTRKLEHVLDNAQGLKLKLTNKQVEYLESVVPFDPGAIVNDFGGDPHVTGKAGTMTAYAASTAFVSERRAIEAVTSIIPN